MSKQKTTSSKRTKGGKQAPRARLKPPPSQEAAATDVVARPGIGPPRLITQPDPIADGLKRLYDDVANEPIPDEFIELLQKLDSATSSQESQDQ